MKKIIRPFLPEGAISLENIDKIYLYRLLEEGGAGDMIPVLSTLARGKALEEEGKYNEVQKLYKTALELYPENGWLKDAAEGVRYVLN